MRGLTAEAACRRHLDARLVRNDPAPVAVALSGGGDSLALAWMARDWAREADRRLLILSVDHGLQADGARWVDACAVTAERLGADFRPLRWTGEKPATGLPAAARAARHRLLAEAARAAGARVILMGHTADDLAETALMRDAGSTTPDPRVWSPSPAWPEGRGVFLLRPLLETTRAELRDGLRRRGESWIEDPANGDLRFARSRARRLAPDATRLSPVDTPLDLAAFCTETAGVISVSRDNLLAVEPEARRRFIAIASVCAGGGARLPSTDRVARIDARLTGGAPFTASLAGARIEAATETVRFLREAGERRRGGLAPLTGGCGGCVWDGRFELAAPAGTTICAAAGLQGRLPVQDRDRLNALPAAARPAIPVLVDAAGEVRLADLSASLVGARLRAAAGLIRTEADLRR